ncbi:MAG: alpha/beta hydrolase-fold protein [Pseudolysinimonas sp.]
MNAWWTGLSLVDGWVPTVVDVAASVLVAGAVILVIRGRRGAPIRRGRRALTIVTSAIAGGAVGFALCWLLSDQLNLFDVSLTPISRAWVVAAFAATATAIAAIVLGRWRARLIASVAIVASLMAGAAGVNADFGQYTTVGSLSDHQVAPPLSASLLAQQEQRAPGAMQSVHAVPGSAGTSRPTHSLALWRTAHVPTPSRGVVGSIVIPATVSHFAARTAYVYLPPAALLPHPVALPVIVMLSGQPGSPGNVIASGGIAAIFDAFARAHHGLAPIVVAPDQLSAPQLNPMCVDGSLGASASYLTVDVPNWIRTHLTVQTDNAEWAIGGFSQGGTCAIQLGSQRPDLYSGIIDVSGQLAPKNGGLLQTIARGFDGDAAEYRAALPVTVLAAKAPYTDSVAVFGVGQLDARYGPVSLKVSAAAERAGIHTTRVVSPGTGHDWHTVKWVLTKELTPILRHMGLEP